MRTQIPTDIISILWFHEHYKEAPDSSSHDLWKIYVNIKDTFTLDSFENFKEESSIRPLSNQDISILYEAVTKETEFVDPNLLFDEYPLHPLIRASSDSLFKKGEYFNAVFEASKTLNDLIKERSGSQNSETQLIKEVIGKPENDISSPKIKFNALDSKSLNYKSQQNEQRGLSYLAHGIFFAFRHPKGHEPKDKWPINPYEALDQLVTISHLTRKIDKATHKPKEP